MRLNPLLEPQCSHQAPAPICPTLNPKYHAVQPCPHQAGGMPTHSYPCAPTMPLGPHKKAGRVISHCHTSLKGSLPVSFRPSMTIRATQKKRMSWPVSSSVPG